MNSKAIKRQLLAAIAMVLVAAVALGSSTYAWFVSNNTVKATTANISAQSNAPFLMIDKDSIKEDSGTAIDFGTNNTKLYPSQVVNNSTAPQFESAYAADKNSADILTGSRFTVGDVATAVSGEYAIKESFKIGTYDAKAGSFNNLVVDSITITGTDKDETDGLKDALCVLVVCGDNWVVYNATGKVTAYADNTPVTGNGTSLAATINAGASNAVNVDVYVFYDGSSANVKTANLSNLLGGVGAAITFTATPVNTQGTEVNVSNAVTTTTTQTGGAGG